MPWLLLNEKLRIESSVENMRPEWYVSHAAGGVGGLNNAAMCRCGVVAKCAMYPMQLSVLGRRPLFSVA